MFPVLAPLVTGTSSVIVAIYAATVTAAMANCFRQPRISAVTTESEAGQGGRLASFVASSSPGKAIGMCIWLKTDAERSLLCLKLAVAMIDEQGHI